MDVMDAVESMKAVLLEVFSGNNRPVSFSPANGEDVEAAQVRTDYVSHVLYEQNKGFGLMQTVIEDGLTNRAGVVKAWWEESKKTVNYDLSDTTYAELVGFLAKNPDAQVKEIEGDIDGQTFKRVRLTMKKDRSQVRLKALAPEQFGISPMSESIAEAELVFHREPKTVNQLLKMGFDKDDIMDLSDNDRLWLTTEPEIMQRFGKTDDMVGMRGMEDGQKSNRQIMLYEAYMDVSSDDEDGESQLMKIMMAGDTILSKEPVDRKPFVAFIPLPIPHAFWGTNFARLLIPTQNARTYLTRSIINHALVTNNPRMMVARGGLSNPRELMENRFGGIVNVKSLDSVAPLPQSGLNPFVFQVRQILGEDKEQITGISALSQGLNKDAISKQNSQQMVQDLITVSQTRQKIIARNFAENFLRELYMMIYQLVVENEDRQKIVAVSGNWVPVDFTQWPEDTEMEVSFALGLNENKAEADKWTKIDQYLSKDPGLSHAYPKEKRFYVIKRALEAMGIKNVTDVVLTPQEIQPPQPSPMDQAHLAVLQADAAAKQAGAQAVSAKVELHRQEIAEKAHEHATKLQLDTQRTQGDLQLKQDALAHKVAVDAAEIVLEKQALAVGKLTGSAAPTH
jgi:hypothetical protein